MELKETRNKSEEVIRNENRRTEEETSGEDEPESKSEDIESWRNLERDVVKQQEMWRDVMAAVTVGNAIRERSHMWGGNKRTGWELRLNEFVRDDGSGNEAQELMQKRAAAARHHKIQRRKRRRSSGPRGNVRRWEGEVVAECRIRRDSEPRRNPKRRTRGDHDGGTRRIREGLHNGWRGKSCSWDSERRRVGRWTFRGATSGRREIGKTQDGGRNWTDGKGEEHRKDGRWSVEDGESEKCGSRDRKSRAIGNEDGQKPGTGERARKVIYKKLTKEAKVGAIRQLPGST